MKPPARRPAPGPSAPRPSSGAPGGRSPATAPAAISSEPAPLTDDELAALQAQIDTLVPAREPLDVTMIDGYLCGVLLQPEPVPETRWLPLILDVDGRPAPAGFDVARLRALVRRRHAELDAAIARRDWFDPWVYELDEAASPSETVLPWVAGFATAVDAFTLLMDRHEPELLEPLATLYRHLDPDDLEDAEELLAEIETYEPPATLDEAVEDLVRSVLLMADVSRPGVAAPAARPARPKSAAGAAARGGSGVRSDRGDRGDRRGPSEAGRPAPGPAPAGGRPSGPRPVGGKPPPRGPRGPRS